MFTFECRTGRLCELRFGAEFLGAEMPRLRARMLEVFASTTGKMSFATDMRRLTRFDGETESQLIELMRADSPRVGRSGFLVRRGTPFAMQVLRMVQTTETRVRRVFHDRVELETWLGEALSAEEQERLRTFLDAE